MRNAQANETSKGSLDLAWTSLGVVQDTSKVERYKLLRTPVPLLHMYEFSLYD